MVAQEPNAIMEEVVVVLEGMDFLELCIEEEMEAMEYSTLLMARWLCMLQEEGVEATMIQHHQEVLVVARMSTASGPLQEAMEAIQMARQAGLLSKIQALVVEGLLGEAVQL
jgi:hypothetical protein